MSGSPPAQSMEGKTCLITGATAGIGLATACELARLGAKVVLVGRSPERCQRAIELIKEQTGLGSAEFLLAELSSQEAIRSLAGRVKESITRLDVLVNNAGGIFLKRMETIDGIEMTFALNHLAYFLLTNLLLDQVRTNSQARIINVSSAAHQGVAINFSDLQGLRRYSGWRAYQQSKLANLLFTYELARRLNGTGVTVNALHPGYVRTEIFRVEGMSGWLLRRFADVFAVPPEQGARTSVHLASSPEVEGITGRYFAGRKAVRSSPTSLDASAAERLWKVSEEMTGLS